jgi:alpha-D-ribose 1-methylphosphonate 5-phosphate C-P lyase
MKTPDLTEMMVMASVQSYERGGDVLTTSGFVVVVQQRFQMNKSPSQEWGNQVLSELTYLESLGSDHWKYLPGPIGNEYGSINGELRHLAGAHRTGIEG